MTDNPLQLSPYSVDGLQTPGFNYSRFQDQLDQLPGELLDFLLDPKPIEFIQSLTQKYIQLSVQGPDIARLIRDVVIADVFLGDMPQEVQRRLGLDPATAREVANLIARELFTPVLEELKQLHRTRFPNRVSPQPPTANIQQGQPATGYQKTTAPQIPSSDYHYPGEDLPESGGNIIDLRQNH